jgi:hypothetical protein
MPAARRATDVPIEGIEEQAMQPAILIASDSLLSITSQFSYNKPNFFNRI